MPKTSRYRLHVRAFAGATLVTGTLLAGSALAQTLPTVVFNEFTNSLDPIFTTPTQSSLSRWSVDKFVFNGSQAAWTDFHITLQVFNGSSWVDSTEFDGISFDQPTPFADWLAGVKVDINGVIVGGWHVNRTNQPIDELDFFFDDFTIQPGQQLSLHFDMSDTIGGNTWRLKQVPTIPEPGTYALWLAGLGLLGLMVRRRQGA